MMQSRQGRRLAESKQEASGQSKRDIRRRQARGREASKGKRGKQQASKGKRCNQEESRRQAGGKQEASRRQAGGKQEASRRQVSKERKRKMLWNAINCYR
jgi:hypothetical protein